MEVSEALLTDISEPRPGMICLLQRISKVTVWPHTWPVYQVLDIKTWVMKARLQQKLHSIRESQATWLGLWNDALYITCIAFDMRTESERVSQVVGVKLILHIVTSAMQHIYQAACDVTVYKSLCGPRVSGSLHVQYIKITSIVRACNFLHCTQHLRWCMTSVCWRNLLCGMRSPSLSYPTFMVAMLVIVGSSSVWITV